MSFIIDQLRNYTDYIYTVFASATQQTDKAVQQAVQEAQFAIDTAAKGVLPLKTLIVQYACGKVANEEASQMYDRIQEIRQMMQIFPKMPLASDVYWLQNAIFSKLRNNVQELRTSDRLIAPLLNQADKLFVDSEALTSKEFDARLTEFANLRSIPLERLSKEETGCYSFVTFTDPENSSLLLRFYKPLNTFPILMSQVILHWSMSNPHSFRYLDNNSSIKVIKAALKAGLITDQLRVSCPFTHQMRPLIVMVPPHIVMELVSYGLNINTKDYNDYTLLDYAIEAFFDTETDAKMAHGEWNRFLNPLSNIPKGDVSQKLGFIKWLIAHDAIVNQMTPEKFKLLVSNVEELKYVDSQKKLTEKDINQLRLILELAAKKTGMVVKNS